MLAFDLIDPEWITNASLLAFLAALVVGRPAGMFGTPERRSVGWLSVALAVAARGPSMWAQDRPGAASAYIVLAALAVWIAHTLRTRRPVGAVHVDVGDSVEAADGFVGRVVQVGPWDYAATVQDVVGTERMYPTDEIRKMGGRS